MTKTEILRILSWNLSNPLILAKTAWELAKKLTVQYRYSERGELKKNENWYWIDLLTIYWIHDHWIPIRPFTKRKKKSLNPTCSIFFHSTLTTSCSTIHCCETRSLLVGPNNSPLKMAQCQWGYDTKVKRLSWIFESKVWILCLGNYQIL